ncbi:MAG: UvrD-helicase domain-containing protein [Candidatus Pacebacteria bacterium]|nr:UvrD-helicase domain-containing protein [Candidatus Paceibacterota bacterium]
MSEVSHLDHLSKLNPAQKEAVLHTNGPLLIVAGAGAGKTKTLTERIVHIILNGVAPERILAVTFTNKASGEMRERVLLATQKHKIEGSPTVTTFHRLGGSIIRENAGYFGLTKYFSIFDEEDTRSLIRESMRELGIDPKILDPKRVKHIISTAKMAGDTPDTMTDKVASQAESDAVRIWRKYEAKLLSSKGVDFDDLIVKAVRLLEKEKKILEMYQNRYQYIHVDEYQDTNEMEYRMVKMLAGEKKNICVVGDTDQNIYSWRGAKIKNMLHFEKDFPGAHTVFLEQNYRSTSRILDAANAIITKNTVRLPKNLFTELGTGEKLTRYESFSETDEAMFVARESAKLIEEGIQPEEIAVLFRANFQSRALEEAFLFASVPYRVIGTQFFERAEVKDIISYIRASVNRDSLADIKRTINKPTRGIGDASVAKIFSGMRDLLTPKTKISFLNYEKILDAIKMATETEYPSALVRKVLELSGLRDEYESEGDQGIERIENVGELATLASIYDTLPLGEGVMKFLEDAALRSDSDALAESPEGVRLLTVHASKGLEFSIVFIVGMEEGLFPHERSARAVRIEDREEERRLFYVALTRAKKKIYLTHASYRTIFGQRNIATASEFLYDIPSELMELHSDIPAELPSIFLE